MDGLTVWLLIGILIVLSVALGVIITYYLTRMR